MTTAQLISRPASLTLFIVLVLIAGFGCNKTDEKENSAKTGGPETAAAAIRAFIDGLKKEDVDKALAVHVNPDRAKATVASQVRSISAANRFRHAAHDKFGANEYIPLVPTLVTRLVEQLNTSPPLENGDKASWDFSGLGPILLVRQQGVWFIDWSGLSDEALKKMSSELDGSSSIIESISEEIESGKFRSMSEMTKALGEKLENAEQQRTEG